jgi:chromosome segregation ATPase
MSTEEAINKSPTSEAKDQESPKKSQDSSTSNSSNSQETQELLNHPYVQDLLLKIDVLKRGIIKERKLNQELSDKLKKFESELTSKIVKLEEEVISKTSQIKILIQEKIDLEQKLKTQKPPKKRASNLLDILNIGLDYNDKIMNKLSEKNSKVNTDQKSVEEISSMANAEMRKLHEKISELKFENETYFNKMNQALEDLGNKKLEYQNEIKKYTDKINSLNEEINNLQKEKQELNERINTTSSMGTQYMQEAEHFRSLLNDYKRDREQANINLNSYVEKYNKLLEENTQYKEALLRHEEDSGKMAQKLAELKNLMIKLNLKNQMFHVKKIGLLSNSEIDILFGNSENGNFIMRIDEKNESEIINIQDVESVEKVKDSNNKVEIIYMRNGKKHNMVVIVNELIVDQMVKAYKIFFSESMKKLNEINY